LKKVPAFNLTLLRNPDLAVKIRRLTLESWGPGDKYNFEKVTDRDEFWCLWDDFGGKIRYGMSTHDWTRLEARGARLWVTPELNMMMLLVLIPNLDEIVFEGDISDGVPVFGPAVFPIIAQHQTSSDEHRQQRWWLDVTEKLLHSRITTLDLGPGSITTRRAPQQIYNMERFCHLQVLSAPIDFWETGVVSLPPNLHMLQLNYCHRLPIYPYQIAIEKARPATLRTIRLLLSLPLTRWLATHRPDPDGIDAFTKLEASGLRMECYSPCKVPLFHIPAQRKDFTHFYHENAEATAFHPADTRMRYEKVDLKGALALLDTGGEGACGKSESGTPKLSQGFGPEVLYMQHEPTISSSVQREHAEAAWDWRMKMGHEEYGFERIL
jgi:hypothetical protein